MQIAELHRAVLEQGGWFSALPDPLKHWLIAHLHVQELEPGQSLFLRGDAREGVYVVLEGMVRVSGLNELGKEAILTFIEASDWFGEVALFDELHRTHDAFAEGPLKVGHVKLADLQAVLAVSPEYWRYFGLLVASKLRLAFTAIEDLSLLPASDRLARRLALMAEGYGTRSAGERRTVRVPQEQLGKMLSISRQTTNQILKELEAEGLIRVTYGEIEIQDLTALKARCGLIA